MQVCIPPPLPSQVGSNWNSGHSCRDPGVWRAVEMIHRAQGHIRKLNFCALISSSNRAGFLLWGERGMLQHLSDKFFGEVTDRGLEKMTQMKKKWHLCLVQAARTQILSCPNLWDGSAQISMLKRLTLNMRWKTQQERWKGSRLGRRECSKGLLVRLLFIINSSSGAQGVPAGKSLIPDLV